VGLDIGPEIGKLEDPTQRTADATEATAEAVQQLAERGKIVSDLNDGQRRDLVKRAEELQAGMGLNALGDTEAQRQKKAAELEQVQSDLAALDAFRATQVAAAGKPVAGPAAVAPAAAPAVVAPADTAGMAFGEVKSQLDRLSSVAAEPNVNVEQLLARAGELSQSPSAPMASGPAVAMDVVAPRAPAVQANAARGMETALTASQTGIDFRQVGSEIVAAVNAGTAVSRSMLGVLTKIAEKKSPELAFQ
jgi:hypothetical protein